MSAHSEHTWKSGRALRVERRWISALSYPQSPIVLKTPQFVAERDEADQQRPKEDSGQGADEIRNAHGLATPPRPRVRRNHVSWCNDIHLHQTSTGTADRSFRKIEKTLNNHGFYTKIKIRKHGRLQVPRPIRFDASVCSTQYVVGTHLPLQARGQPFRSFTPAGYDWKPILIGHVRFLFAEPSC